MVAKALYDQLGTAHPASEIGALPGSGITFATGVPDSVFSNLIGTLEAGELGTRYLLATREDSAVALAVGAYLAGEQPLVFMESAGFGTSLDAITSLAIAYEVPLVLLIAWAGYRGRDVTHHNAIGEPLLELIGALELPVETCGQSELATDAFPEHLVAAVASARAARRPSVILVIPSELEEGDKR